MKRHQAALGLLVHSVSGYHTRMTHRESLIVEQAAFEAQLDLLMESHPGTYALFHDGHAIDFFEQHEDAYVAALDRFGPDGVFLIAKVERSTPRSVSLAWDAGVMFG